MIKVENLIKKYKKRVVLNIRQLEINKGDIIGIMGLNGSGKTTLGELIIGTKKSKMGTIKYDANDYRKNAVFQDCSYDSELPLIEIINFYKNIFKGEESIEELLKLFEFTDFKKSQFRKLSNGEKQKFKFLIASLNRPNFLLLDELTTSLDYIWKDKIINIIQNQIKKNNSTVLLISHDVNEVAAICNRIIFLQTGKIVYDRYLNQEYEQEKVRFIKSIINGT